MDKLTTLRVDYTEPRRVSDGMLSVGYKTRHGFERNIVVIKPTGHERRLAVTYDKDMELEGYDAGWSLSAYARTDARHDKGAVVNSISAALLFRISLTRM